MGVHTCRGASAGGREKLRRAECSWGQVSAPHPAEDIETERGRWCFCDSRKSWKIEQNLQ